MTEWNGQCRRQYGNVSNQFNECIQNCQHIRQWCARRRHNSQQIELFVFSGVFSSTALPATSELASAKFSLFINSSAFLSVSSLAFSWTSMFCLSEITCTCFCPNNGLSFNKEGWLCFSPLQPSQFLSELWFFSVGGFFTTINSATECGFNSHLLVFLLILRAGVYPCSRWHITQQQREHSLSAS